jgi:hypothetical protein
MSQSDSTVGMKTIENTFPPEGVGACPLPRRAAGNQGFALGKDKFQSK